MDTHFTCVDTQTHIPKLCTEHSTQQQRRPLRVVADVRKYTSYLCSHPLEAMCIQLTNALQMGGGRKGCMVAESASPLE